MLNELARRRGGHYLAGWWVFPDVAIRETDRWTVEVFRPDFGFDALVGVSDDDYRDNILPRVAEKMLTGFTAGPGYLATPFGPLPAEARDRLEKEGWREGVLHSSVVRSV